MIDSFSRWVELFPTKATGASEAAGCTFQHFGRFETPNVIYTDQDQAMNSSRSSHGCLRFNIPSPQRTRRRRTVSSSALIKKSCDIFVPCFFATFSSSQASPMCHVFATHVHDKWSKELSPMVQRTAFTGVTSPQLDTSVESNL